jgi:ABC-2 type transport system permease protein
MSASPAVPATSLEERNPEGDLRAPRGHFSVPQALGAEWIKLRTVRSTGWSLVIIVVLTIGISAAATSVEAARWSHLSLTDRLRFDPVRLSLTGILLAQLAVGILGILVMTAEYSTGTIRATFAALPRRLLVLGAKLAVFGVMALVVSEVVSFIAFYVGQAILGGPTRSASLGTLAQAGTLTTAFHATLGQPGVLRAVVASGLYLTALGLIGLGIGTLIRHTAGSIAVFVGILFIFPLVLNVFPQSVINAVGKYLPANIGVSMISVHGGFGDVPLFSPWAGFGVLMAYAAGILVAAGILLVRRDA